MFRKHFTVAGYEKKLVQSIPCLCAVRPSLAAVIRSIVVVVLVVSVSVPGTGQSIRPAVAY